MAKAKMVCPFSKGLCVECPQYRGRHYYLCFCTKYRGFLVNTEGRDEKISLKTYEIPPAIPRSPKWLILDDFLERNEE